MGHHIIVLLIQIAVIVIIVTRKNPYQKGSGDWQSIRLCKTGMCFAVASFEFGLLGFALALVAFVLGIAGLIKGQTFYGIRIILASILIPAMGVIL